MGRTTSLTVELGDGRRITVAIRRHPNYRNMRLVALPDGTARLSAPERARLGTLRTFVGANRDWLQEHVPGPPDSIVPERLELPALGETWRVVIQTGSGRLSARDGKLRLPAATEDENLARIKAWLKERARTELGARLSALSSETGLKYDRLAIRGQTARWGSYSSRGTVSLNWKLLFLPRELCDHVLLHELCHSLHMNHSAAYWATVAGFEPRWRELERRIRGGLHHLPDWVLRT